MLHYKKLGWGCGLLCLGLLILGGGCESSSDEAAAPNTSLSPAPTPPATTNEVEEANAGRYPWDGQEVEVVERRYHAVHEYEEVAELTNVQISGGRITFDFEPNPPWPTFRVSSWDAQGDLVVMRQVDGQWRKYWGDYFTADKYNRAVSELANHMGSGRPSSGETVWIAACNGDRSRQGDRRSSWVSVRWP